MSNSLPVNAVPAALNPGRVRVLALEAGFAEAGVVALPYGSSERDAGRFEQWIAAGNAGSMRYLERSGEDGRLLRSDVARPFPWARSAIVCFALYNSGQPRSVEPAPRGTGWIARYAWTGRKDAAGNRRSSDYHKVLRKRLAALEDRLHVEWGGFEARGFVDTGPIVERSLAVAAGLGWTGKNTCLIHPRLGSYGFLAVLLTALEVGESASQRVSESAGMVMPDRCGTCRRCIEACPTDALTPYRMDAAKCISYLTIEHKGPIDKELMAKMGRQVFGCDICQDVCPWNRPQRAPLAADPDLAPREELVNPALAWLAALTEAEFEARFNGSPVRRAGFNGLRRNVAIAIGNAGLRELVPVLAGWAEAADEGMRAAARWALGRLRGSGESPADS